MSGLSVAVVGATGVVGLEFLRILEERAFPVAELQLLASKRSAGAVLSFAGQDHPVGALEDATFRGVDVAFFSAGAARGREHAPRAAAAGALVVDNSSAFRRDPEVPLVVPQVNGDAAASHRGIIANPNCSTILLVMVLAPIERRWGIERVVCATYQAVSGSGAAAIAEWEAQTAAEGRGDALESRVYPKPIHGNVLPFVQGFGDADITTEEWKMVHETRRLLGRDDLRLTCTCARVPVRRAHSEAVNLELRSAARPEEVRRLLARSPGLQLMDDPAAELFPTPRDAEGGDAVLVGRVRSDPSHPRGIDLWLTGDQVRKGAALNAIEIAEGVLGVGPPRLDRPGKRGLES